MLSLKMKLACAVLLFLWPVITYAQSGSPVLHAGTVILSGKVTIPKVIRKDSVWLMLTIPQPFTGENKMYRTLLDSSGRFVLKVNTETNLSRCAISTDISMDHLVTVLLKSGQENKVSFNYSDDGTITKVSISDNPGFTEADLIQGLKKFDEVLSYRSSKPRVPLYNKTFSAFVDHANNAILDRRPILNNPPFLSEKMKEILFKDYSLAMHYTHVFNYRNEMVINYSNTNNGKMPDSSEIKEPLRQDYSFLKNLDLNNRLNLYCFSYPTFTQELLQNNILNIPRIQETPIHEWIKNVKDILGQLIGFDRGMYYDMLVGNAYGVQFELELKPLTPKQIENIKKYYKGGDLEKILLRRNKEVMQEALFKETVVVNKTLDVSPEELMSAIVSAYKGKTVIVDFWATWCSPCLEAIKKSRDIKKQLIDKGAVFVYISGPTSPRKLWEMHVKGIGGEQYYLTTAEWKHMMDSFDFSGIPSYLIFDKKGELKQQFTGYPGNEIMQKRIEAVMEGDLKTGL